MSAAVEIPRYRLAVCPACELDRCDTCFIDGCLCACHDEPPAQAAAPRYDAELLKLAARQRLEIATAEYFGPRKRRAA